MISHRIKSFLISVNKKRQKKLSAPGWIILKNSQRILLKLKFPIIKNPVLTEMFFRVMKKEKISKPVFQLLLLFFKFRFLNRNVFPDQEKKNRYLNQFFNCLSYFFHTGYFSFILFSIEIFHIAFRNNYSFKSELGCFRDPPVNVRYRSYVS